jgi:hypothetical protein
MNVQKNSKEDGADVKKQVNQSIHYSRRTDNDEIAF